MMYNLIGIIVFSSQDNFILSENFLSTPLSASAMTNSSNNFQNLHLTLGQRGKRPPAEDETGQN